MILELEIDFIKKLNISLNQLILLSLINSGSKSNIKNANDVLNLIPGKEIEDLVNRNIVIINKDNDNVIYKISKEVEEMLEKQQASYFDEFYNTFPVYDLRPNGKAYRIFIHKVLRPDGTKGYLKANVNKCRKEYNKIIGKSKAMHDHIMDCLKFELQDKVTTGKMIYMQTMWKWLVQHGWEYYEDRVKEETIKTEAYGTTVF